MVSAANTLLSNDAAPPAMLTMIALSGVPMRVRAENCLGRWPWSLRVQSIREAAYNPELAADNRAVMITKFMISAE
ncbi:hypothetical protein D3C85_1473980 [compost metagenome]